jgi:hypothetical protein
VFEGPSTVVLKVSGLDFRPISEGFWEGLGRVLEGILKDSEGFWPLLDCSRVVGYFWTILGGFWLLLPACWLAVAYFCLLLLASARYCLLLLAIGALLAFPCFLLFLVFFSPLLAVCLILFAFSLRFLFHCHSGFCASCEVQA